MISIGHYITTIQVTVCTTFYSRCVRMSFLFNFHYDITTGDVLFDSYIYIIRR